MRHRPQISTYLKTRGNSQLGVYGCVVAVVTRLRTVDVSSSAQLNAINENIALNGGLVCPRAYRPSNTCLQRSGLLNLALDSTRVPPQLSFKLRRSCSSGLSGAVANSFYGVAFPGTANAALNPSYDVSHAIAVAPIGFAHHDRTIFP